MANWQWSYYFALLCILIPNLIWVNKKAQQSSKERLKSIFLFNSFWIFFVGILLLEQLLPVAMSAQQRLAILSLVLGLMTTVSAMDFMGYNSSKAVRENEVSGISKKRNVMKKVPWLGALAFLTIFNELGTLALKWIHWGGHLSILVMLFLSKKWKCFYWYSLATVILTLYYLLEKDSFNIPYYVILYSVVSIFVSISLSLKENIYDQ